MNVFFFLNSFGTNVSLGWLGGDVHLMGLGMYRTIGFSRRITAVEDEIRFGSTSNLSTRNFRSRVLGFEGTRLNVFFSHLCESDPSFGFK